MSISLLLLIRLVLVNSTSSFLNTQTYSDCADTFLSSEILSDIKHYPTMKLPFTFSGSLAINSKLRCEILLQILQKHFYIELKQKQGLLVMSKALQPFPVENFRCGQMGSGECDFTPKWKLHQAAETGKTLESPQV